MDTFAQLEALVLSEMLEIKRAVEILEVLNAIYNDYGLPPYPVKAEVDEERPTEEKESQDEPPEVDS